ncbi:MAG: hypothetical protein ACR2RF_10320 [Geminicoccaceae bacterium]
MAIPLVDIDDIETITSLTMAEPAHAPAPPALENEPPCKPA